MIVARGSGRGGIFHHTRLPRLTPWRRVPFRGYRGIRHESQRCVSPTDLVASALGTCMATIMGLVAQRNNLNIDGLQVQVIKEMASEPVRRIGTLKTRLVFPRGKVLAAADRAKLEAAAKACPVKQSLHPDVQLPVEFVYPVA